MEEHEVFIKLAKNAGLALLPAPFRVLVETITSCRDSEELKNHFDELKKYADKIARGMIYPEVAIEQEVRWVNLIVIRTIDPLDSSLERDVHKCLEIEFPAFEPDIELLKDSIWLTVQMPREDARDVSQKICEYLNKKGNVKVKAVSYI